MTIQNHSGRGGAMLPAADRFPWCARVEALLPFFDTQLRFGPDVPPGVKGEALCIILTATLENLGEVEIDCLEAAAFYALSHHEEWSHAGRSWLLPMRKTWLVDWIAARPAYRALAKQVGKSGTHVASWLQRPEREA